MQGAGEDIQGLATQETGFVGLYVALGVGLWGDAEKVKDNSRTSGLDRWWREMLSLRQREKEASWSYTGLWSYGKAM